MQDDDIQIDRINSLGHAIQAGVAMEQNYRSEPTDPKHLRTGLDLRACDHAALTRLLVTKGLITNEEYLDAVEAEYREEKKRYEMRISDILYERTGNRTKVDLV